MSILPPNEARKRLVACQKALKQIVQSHPKPLTAREIFFNDNNQPRRWREETIRKLLTQGIVERHGGVLPTYTATDIVELRKIVQDNEAIARILWPSPVSDLMVTRGVTEGVLSAEEPEKPSTGGRKPGPPVLFYPSNSGDDIFHCRFTWNKKRYFRSTGKTDPVEAQAAANRIYKEITGQSPPPSLDEEDAFEEFAENLIEQVPADKVEAPVTTAQELPPPPVLEGVKKPPQGSSEDVVREWIFILLHAQTENLIYIREKVDAQDAKIDRILSILEKLL